MRTGWALATVAVAVLVAGRGAAQDVLIRSDLPLWTGEAAENLWPRHFFDQDTFGCASNVQFGDYRLTEPDESGGPGGPGFESWWRLGNYGVFHCAYMFSRAGEQTELTLGFENHAWIVELGEQTTGAGTVELLALQIGARGGSTYLLLSRPKEPALSGHLTVLNPTCPRGAIRRTQSLDVWLTDYCVVSSQNALRRMARDAAKKPPVGNLELVPSLADSGD